MKNIKYFFQFLFILILFFLFKIMGYKNASNFGSNVGKKFGKIIRSNKIILKNLNIKIGFIPNMLYGKRNNFTANNFEIAREDHSNIKRKLDLKRIS